MFGMTAKPDPQDILATSLADSIFPKSRQLLPNLNDVYELELAFYENCLLDDNGLIRNGAYFAKIEDRFTNHFLMCAGDPLKLPDFSSSRLKSFFQQNIFRTGYATHGLFPYRGKFHPQMIKGLLNAMGLKPGDTVLDPMMGSGTVLVEASLMGIRSIGIDASPFCRFMTQTKLDALDMPLRRAREAVTKSEEVFNYFVKRGGKPSPAIKAKRLSPRDNLFNVMEDAAAYLAQKETAHLKKSLTPDTIPTYNFLLLAFLDACGYSERSARNTPVDQFGAILNRYLGVADKIQKFIESTKLKIAQATVCEGDARDTTLEKESVDGIVFSPPYSFAIDYLENDSYHLKYLKVDVAKLKEHMIGLRGSSLQEKFDLYCQDIDKVLAECARVLRKGRFCSIIVGTNSNQLGKVFNKKPEEVQGLHEILVDMAAKHGLRLVRQISRSIMGISNTMRREYILMLRKNDAPLL
jgi:hypothetical protein